MDQDTFLSSLYVKIEIFANLTASMRTIVLGQLPRCRVVSSHTGGFWPLGAVPQRTGLLPLCVVPLATSVFDLSGARSIQSLATALLRCHRRFQWVSGGGHASATLPV